MGVNVVPQRRNLRPRKPWGTHELEAAPPRKIRQSRAKLSAGDFLVFDNEEDADFDEDTSNANAEEEEEEEAEPGPESRRRSRRIPGRSSYRQESSSMPSPYAGRREILRQRQIEREREHERVREKAREQLRARSRSRAKSRRSSHTGPTVVSRRSRTRRPRSIIDDELELEPEFNGEAAISGDEADEDLDEDDEDEDGYDSELEDELVLNHHKNRRKARHPRKPKVLLPEDVFGRDLQPNQPEPDPEDVRYSPSVAFLAIFVATFVDVFPDLPTLPCPQDIEEGLVTPTPSELVEFLFRRLLGLVLNRKKEIEVGRYGSALSELHSLRNSLGMGSFFPALNWKSRGNAFAELSWMDRAEILHVLAHWSLTSSEKIKQLVKTLDESSTMPWMGADEKGTHFYIVGFDPLSEGSSEYTRFRIYRETNRLLATVKWEPIASNSYEVVNFLRQQEIRQNENSKATPEVAGAENAQINTSDEVEQLEVGEKAEQNDEAEPTKEAPEAADDAPKDPIGSTDAEQNPEGPPNPPKYDLPDSVVQILNEFLPLMQISEKISMERYEREAKRARRKRDLQYQTEAVSRREGQYSGRLRRRRTNYSEYLRDAYGGVSDEDSDSSSRKRRLRNRGDDYAWREPEPESREQRHARLLAERAEREQSEMPNFSPEETSVENSEQVDVSEQPTAANEASQADAPAPEPARPQVVHLPPNEEHDSAQSGQKVSQLTESTQLQRLDEPVLQPHQPQGFVKPETDTPERVAHVQPFLVHSSAQSGQEVSQLKEQTRTQQSEEPFFHPHQLQGFATPETDTPETKHPDSRMNLNSIMQSLDTPNLHESVPSLRTQTLSPEAISYEKSPQLPSMQTHPYNEPEQHP